MSARDRTPDSGHPPPGLARYTRGALGARETDSTSERATVDLMPPGELDLEADEGPAGAGGDGAPGGRGGLDDLRARMLREVDGGAPRSEAAADAARRRIDGFAAIVRRELDAGALERAAVAADLAMDEQPETAVAQKSLHEHAPMLLRAYESFLGAPDSVPLVALPLHELPAQKLDSRAAFLLSRVDGTLSFDEIFDVSGMPRLEACGYLSRLVLQGIIDVR